MEAPKSYDQLLEENRELSIQLEEAQDAIHAIRTGRVDAVIVQGEDGHELYTLKSADQAYRVFIEKMNEGAITLHKDGTILYCNSKFASMLNKPLEKVMGMSIKLFIPLECHQKFQKLSNQGWTSNTKGEINLLTANGEHKPCLMSCNQMELEDGVALSLIVTDLTAQKESEKQLLIKNEQLEQVEQITRGLNFQLEALIAERTQELDLSREQFKFLADNIPVIVWTSKPDGSIDYYNNRWYTYTGLTFEETKDWGWEKVIHPADLQGTLRAWSHSLATGEPYEVEYRFLRNDGRYHWHLGYALPFKDKSGNIIAWFGSCTDIEDQKQQIEKRDEFISIASHELKTPLTSAKGYLEIIGAYKKQHLPPAVSEYINKAKTAVNKLQTLVSDLLDVSKIHAGQLQYDLIDFNLSDLVNTCIENFTHLYPDRHLVCECEKVMLVKGNPGRLEQVIMNLISNAVKYSAAGTEISILAHKEGSNAVIAIIDSGIGLSDEQKQRIFERFYRVEDKKFLTSGLGMGLYISSEIIKAHGGELRVSSEYGEGSTFSIELPLLQK
ncbi:MAG TPA: ATP-binding protein [Sphingobacteriaceae bacterium]